MGHTRAVLALAIPLLLVSSGALAGCGWDIPCSISESIGRGAGGAAAAQFRPLITEVMEREAPALIEQLKAGVDHNILTAEQATERIIDYATKVILVAVDKKGKDLLEYARVQAEQAETKLISDLGTLLKENIKEIHCELLGANALIANQQVILSNDVDSWLSKIPFLAQSKEVNKQCTADYGDIHNKPISSLDMPTLYKVWRCVRINYVNGDSSATAILSAYEDMDSKGHGVACALKDGSSATLSDITELWLSDGRSVAVWRRAMSGE